MRERARVNIDKVGSSPLNRPAAQRVAAVVAAHKAGAAGDAHGARAALGTVGVDIGAHQRAALRHEG